MKAPRSISCGASSSLRLVTLLTVGMLSLFEANASPPAEFSEGNEAYLSGDFERARALYKSAVHRGDYSASLFFNLGNAEYRLGDPGHAALDYRRALALKPGFAEASANLRLVRDENAARFATPHPAERLFPRLSPHAWTIATSIAAWLSIFLVTALATGHRHPAVWLATVAAILLCAYSATGLRLHHSNRNLGVVVATDKTEARSSPANTAKVTEALPAASEVSILLTRGRWIYCLLPDGDRAWLPADSVVRVVPAKS